MNLNLSFRPRLFKSLQGYTAAQAIRDAGAGVTVGIVALPLAMAFAIASGLKPEVGIFTAIVGGLIVSLLGGSSVQIGGPAGAFIVVVADIVQRHGVTNLIIATAVAGLLLLLMGLFRMGNLIRLIPVSIVTGFTNGIAILIALSQIKDFFGLQIDNLPSAFIPKLNALVQASGTVNTAAMGLGCAGLLLLMLWPKMDSTVHHAGPRNQSASMWHSMRRIIAFIPAPVIVLLLSGLAANLLSLPIQTIGTRFGGIPQGFPDLHAPDLSWDTLTNLWGPIITITLLGAIESLLCARVADNLIRERHDPNQELMAQGIANLTVPLFGGMPVTGTIARTSLNARLGARTPVAGAVHAFTLLLVVLVAAPLAQHVPLCALAAILLFMAWNMGEWSAFIHMRHLSFIYRTILLSTFVLTVVLDLTVAVEVGLVLASLFFIYRISQLTDIEPIHLQPADRAHGIVAYHLYGSLFFGAVGKLETLLEQHDANIKVMVLECHQLISVDTTGIDALESLAGTLKATGAQLVLCDMNRQPRQLMDRSGFTQLLGAQHIQAKLADALSHARQLCARSP